MEKHTEIKEIKAAIKKLTKYEDDFHLTVMVYDCDESGEQTYDVEVSLYINGEYVDTWVTDTGYEGEEAVALKRARTVRTAMLRDFDDIDIVKVYTM